MKRKILLKGTAAVFFFLLFFFSPLWSHEPVKFPALRWDVLKLEPGDEKAMSLIAGAGFEIIGGSQETGVEFLADREQRRFLESRGVITHLLIEDYGRVIAERNRKEATLAAEEEFAVGSMDGYFSPDEIHAYVDSLIKKDAHGIISDTFHIGSSLLGNPIWGIRVSGSREDNEELPEVLYNSLIHGCEGPSVMSLLFYLRFLADNYGVVDSVTDLVDSRELYLIPVVNPDAYEINWLNYYNYNSFSFWRKNARDNNGNDVLDDQDGIDLNRNFGYQWGYDDVGSSPDQSQYSFRGSAPFSEPEARALRDFINERSFVAAVDMHTPFAWLINPFCYSDQRTPDSLLYNRLGEMLTSGNAYRHGGWACFNGGYIDWMYADTAGRGKIISWLLEVGTDEQGGVWAQRSSITGLAEENLGLLFNVARISGFWPEVDSVTAVHIGSGEKRSILRLKLSNIGLRSNRAPLSLRFESASEGLTVVEETVNLENLHLAAGQEPPFTWIETDNVIIDSRASRRSAFVKITAYEGEQRLRSNIFPVAKPIFSRFDLNTDGSTNIFDLLLMLRVVSCGVPEGEEAARYDLNSDGSINIFDLLEILRWL